MFLADLNNIEAQIAEQEARVPNLRPGCEKRIVWAGAPATKTAHCVLFIHGFSATGHQIRPLPDLVAKDASANLFITRLNGHGQDGDAMGRASLDAWQADVAEALDIAQTLGDEIIVIGCSTGCTLATLAFAQGASARAMIHVSPNFGLANALAQGLLELPASKQWAKYIAGSKRSFSAHSLEHAAYWTLEYPTDAVHVMADTVMAARQADLAKITTPALFCFNEKDKVVSAKQTRRIIARWGAPIEVEMLVQTPKDDAMGHIMAGDIFSPGQTAPLAARISAWLDGLPTR